MYLLIWRAVLEGWSLLRLSASRFLALKNVLVAQCPLGFDECCSFLSFWTGTQLSMFTCSHVEDSEEQPETSEHQTLTQDRLSNLLGCLLQSDSKCPVLDSKSSHSWCQQQNVNTVWGSVPRPGWLYPWSLPCSSSQTNEEHINISQKAFSILMLEARAELSISRSVMSNSLHPHGCQAPLSMGFSRQEYWSG